LSIIFERGTHVCHLFRSFSEQKGVALPFIRGGLRHGEHCFFTTVEHSPDEWYLELQAFGIDVQAEREKGALLVVSEEQARPPGDFNAIRLARGLWGMIEELLVNFTGVRLAREVPWASGSALTLEQLCQMEVTGSLLFEGTDVRALCQFDLNRHHPAAIHTALRTHPSVILDGRLFSNPFYEAKQILENEPLSYHSGADAETVAEMLGHFG
jgi:hypothetical protein